MTDDGQQILDQTKPTKGGFSIMQSTRRSAPAQVLRPFKDQWAVLLTTFRRDGTPVRTPVNIAVDADGERAFIRTWDATWKFKHLRNNPQVEIAPSTFRG